MCKSEVVPGVIDRAAPSHLSPPHERVSLRTVNLDNCDQEPIHLPGSIQPHGALLALDFGGGLTHLSRNAAEFFPGLHSLHPQAIKTRLWGSAMLREAADGMLEDANAAGTVAPLSIEAAIDGSAYDVVLHSYAGRVLVEFEHRAQDVAELSHFAVMAHRSMSRLKTRPSIHAILTEAVATVRKITGFDRVMAYRFHGDDSGEIVAEARIDAVEPYLGRRFPAADIPVQARRLYVINTLRLIADVHDEQVAIDALDPMEKPLDMSYGILRSVSPIHVEYLKNIGVSASMSVSIVVAGKLWGLIACHHRTSLRVPHVVRMACDVLANVAASAVQLLLEHRASARRAAAIGLRAKLVELAAADEDSSIDFGHFQATITSVIPCDAVMFSHGSTLRHEGITRDAATELLRWLDVQKTDLVTLNDLSTLDDALRMALAPLSGVLAMCHDGVNRGWVVLLRSEQAATVTWSGPPDKVARVGPMGTRLTPDGSMAEWHQDVAGTAAPWDELDLALARHLVDEVRHATAARATEMERARAYLLAVLGHDLRDPLQAISMAAVMLGRGADQASVGKRISSSTHRMSRLISQVLDMSRLHGGLGLGLQFESTRLSDFITSLIDESMFAHPDVVLKAELQADVVADVDRDRLGQAIVNLLSNARQHGAAGEQISVSLRVEGASAVFQVADVAPALGASLVKCLFDPLKRSQDVNQRNPNGLGLGLYIASETVKGHRGSLRYSHDGRCVVFTLVLPLLQSGAV